MFKASIFLVAAALITLAYGWVSGIDAVLYASIGFSAVAGLALLASTISDRKRFPREESPPRPRIARGEAPTSAFAEPPPPPPRRPLRPEPHYPPPEQTFRWSEEEELNRGLGARETEEPAGSPGTSDFRSRLAAALAATEDKPAAPRSEHRPTPRTSERRPPPPPKTPPPPKSRRPVETEEVEPEWIRIDDLPGMAEGTPVPGGLYPARKKRKPRVVEAGGTGPEQAGPPGPEQVGAPEEGEPAARARESQGGDDASSRPRIRPRQRP